MDCRSGRFRRSLLVFLTLLSFSACISKQTAQVIDPVEVAKDAKCAEVAPKRENCDFHGDAFMTITVVAKPSGDKKDKLNPHVMSAFCEVQTLNIEDPTAKPNITPCPDVKLTVANPTILGDKSRVVPVGAREAIVGGLPNSLYSVAAASEFYKTNVEIKEIPSGSQVKIIIQTPVKIVPATPPPKK